MQLSQFVLPHIELTQDPKAAILSYFEPSVSIISKFKPYLSRYKKIDFLLIRRFLGTTYRTLTELDSQFMAVKLLKTYNDIEHVAHTYKRFIQKNKLNEQAFNKIFLQIQTNYLILEKKFNFNKNKILELKLRISQLEETVKRHKYRLNQSKPYSNDYNKQLKTITVTKKKIQEDIEFYRSLYHDNIIIHKTLMDFLITNKEIFYNIYEKITKQIGANLLSILNAMAFEFNIQLWHKAKESFIIKEHFKDLKGDLIPSFKLYLKHYLNSLDHNNVRKNDKNLKLLLDSLNKINLLNIILLIPNIKILKTFELALQSDDSGFKIHSLTNKERALAIALTEKINIFILDIDLGDKIIRSFIKVYNKYIDDNKYKKAQYILISDSLDDFVSNKVTSWCADIAIKKDSCATEIIDTVYFLKDNN